MDKIKIKKLLKILASEDTGRILHWLVCGGMAIISLLFIFLAIANAYPSAISAAIVFGGSAIIFAPPVKAPFWLKLILGLLLAVLT
ncbi:MAG: hypothetical protein WBM86_03135 [Waterburya sp.]